MGSVVGSVGLVVVVVVAGGSGSGSCNGSGSGNGTGSQVVVIMAEPREIDLALGGAICSGSRVESQSQWRSRLCLWKLLQWIITGL